MIDAQIEPTPQQPSSLWDNPLRCAMQSVAVRDYDIFNSHRPPDVIMTPALGHYCRELITMVRVSVTRIGYNTDIKTSAVRCGSHSHIAVVWFSQFPTTWIILASWQLVQTCSTILLFVFGFVCISIYDTFSLSCLLLTMSELVKLLADCCIFTTDIFVCMTRYNRCMWLEKLSIEFTSNWHSHNSNGRFFI